MDDFTGKFCCQGHFPLVRTVKAILENEPKFMPPPSICQSCPTQEYKTLKKKLRKRRAADEVCTEKGEGVWQDTSDCTKYYTCRSMSTAWAEKKHETCYSGSYFDPKGGQCKWVGQGNYNCDTILGKDAESESESGGKKSKKDDEDDATTKSPGGEEPSSSGGGADGESSPSSLSGTDGIKNRQKIFYELSATNSKQQSALADGIIPPSLYTCKAEVSVEYESNSDYVKCYSCEADAKSIAKCQETPNANSTLVIWCYAKTQKCFSKALYNTSNKNEIISFTRGCTSVSDMASSTATGADSADTGTTTTKAPPAAGSTPLSNCVQRSSTTKACYIMCDKNLCNTHDDLKSGGASSKLPKHSLKSTLTYLVTFMYISLQMTSLINNLL